MITNSLKYQQGGKTVSQEDQKKLAAFIEWLPKRVKDFQGMKPEAIAQAIEGMMKTANGKKQVMKLFQQFNEESEAAASGTQTTPYASAFKNGGKMQDFICKHGRGGKNCGCKQEGGSLDPDFQYTGEYTLQDRNNPNLHSIQSHGYRLFGRDLAVPTKEGAFRMGTEPGAAYNNGEMVYSPSAWENIRTFYEDRLPNSNKVVGPKEKLAGMKTGGIVEKHQQKNNEGRGVIADRSIWDPVYTNDHGTFRNFYFYPPEGGYAGTVDMSTGKAYRGGTGEEMLQPGLYNRKGYPINSPDETNGTWYEVNPHGRIIVNIPEGGQQVLHGNDSTAVANAITQWDQSKVGHAVTAKQNGGEIAKAQNGLRTELNLRAFLNRRGSYNN